MKKFFSYGFVLLFALFSFSACSATEVETLGTAFVEDIFAEKYDTASEQMSEELKANVTQDTLKEMVTSVTTQSGAFDSIISATVGDSTEYPDYSIVKVYVKCVEEKIEFELAYDKNKNLAGINLYGSEESMTAKDSQTDYRDDAKRFVEILFSEDVSPAYAMLNQAAKETYTEDNLSMVQKESLDSVGAYTGMGPASQNGSIVKMSVEFEKGSFAFSVTFDANGEISDFAVVTQENE